MCGLIARFSSENLCPLDHRTMSFGLSMCCSFGIVTVSKRVFLGRMGKSPDNRQLVRERFHIVGGVRTTVQGPGEAQPSPRVSHNIEKLNEGKRRGGPIRLGRPKRCQEQFPGPCIPGTAFIRKRKLFLTPFILPLASPLISPGKSISPCSLFSGRQWK